MSRGCSRDSGIPGVRESKSPRVRDFGERASWRKLSCAHENEALRLDRPLQQIPDARKHFADVLGLVMRRDGRRVLVSLHDHVQLRVFDGDAKIVVEIGGLFFPHALLHLPKRSLERR